MGFAPSAPSRRLGLATDCHEEDCETADAGPVLLLSLRTLMSKFLQGLLLTRGPVLLNILEVKVHKPQFRWVCAIYAPHNLKPGSLHVLRALKSFKAKEPGLLQTHAAQGRCCSDVVNFPGAGQLQRPSQSRFIVPAG